MDAVPVFSDRLYDKTYIFNGLDLNNAQLLHSFISPSIFFVNSRPIKIASALLWLEPK